MLSTVGQNSRRPNSWTPFSRRELADLARQARELSSEELRRRYTQSHDMAGIEGGRVPRPSTMQQLVLLWKEMWRRLPKGRD